ALTPVSEQSEGRDHADAEEPATKRLVRSHHFNQLHFPPVSAGSPTSVGSAPATPGPPVSAMSGSTGRSPARLCDGNCTNATISSVPVRQAACTALTLSPSRYPRPKESTGIT